MLGCNLKNNRMLSDWFQGKPFNITVIQVYASTNNAEEAEVEWFYDEDIQDLLELTLKKDRMVSVHFQGKSFNNTVIQVYAPTSNAEEAEVEWFYE